MRALDTIKAHHAAVIAERDAALRASRHANDMLNDALAQIAEVQAYADSLPPPADAYATPPMPTATT